MPPKYAPAPQLTRFRAAVGGVLRDFVEHDGKPLLVLREDCRTMVIGGRAFPLADETMVAAVHGGGAAVLRCVEYSDQHGVTMRLTVTEGKEVAEVVEPDDDVRVLGSSCYSDTDTGTVEHLVDVQGEREAFILLVSVREEHGRIVRIQRLN
ncbi:hypothetical protein ABZP36_014268 [Zizania latifolia]